MDYPCISLVIVHSFSCFGSIARTDKHRHTHTDAVERFTPATLDRRRKKIRPKYI